MHCFLEQIESPTHGIAVNVHCGTLFTNEQVSVVQGLLSLQIRPPCIVHCPVDGVQRFSPHCPEGTAGQTTGFVALQTHCPLTFTGVIVAHLFVGQTTGLVTQVPFWQI
jgi:hypothetical protein